MCCRGEMVFQLLLVISYSTFLHISPLSSPSPLLSLPPPQADQDQLSVEDDSVNRVASMITTLLHVACVSPVSERNVAALLINAVGQIDHDLVAKVTVNREFP